MGSSGSRRGDLAGSLDHFCPLPSRFQEVQSLEMELGQVPERWKETWDKVKAFQQSEGSVLDSKVRSPAVHMEWGSGAAFASGFYQNVFIPLTNVSLRQHPVLS